MNRLEELSVDVPPRASGELPVIQDLTPPVYNNESTRLQEGSEPPPNVDIAPVAKREVDTPTLQAVHRRTLSARLALRKTPPRAGAVVVQEFTAGKYNVFIPNAAATRRLSSRRSRRTSSRSMWSIPGSSVSELSQTSPLMPRVRKHSSAFRHTKRHKQLGSPRTPYLAIGSSRSSGTARWMGKALRDSALLRLQRLSWQVSWQGNKHKWSHLHRTPCLSILSLLLRGHHIVRKKPPHPARLYRCSPQGRNSSSSKSRSRRCSWRG